MRSRIGVVDLVPTPGSSVVFPQNRFPYLPGMDSYGDTTFRGCCQNAPTRVAFAKNSQQTMKFSIHGVVSL